MRDGSGRPFTTIALGADATGASLVLADAALNSIP